MKSRLLLNSGRVVDPSRGIDEILDIHIVDGKIIRIAKNLAPEGAQTIPLQGFVIAPGFIDMHVHLREPGKEEAETIQTGTLAAAAGGFTAVACMPNTSPVNDNIHTTQFILNKAHTEGIIGVYPIAAITRNEAGMELTDLKELHRNGVVAFSDDGKPVTNSRLMRQALEFAAENGCPVIDHCEDPYLFEKGVLNEGYVAAKFSVQGIPPAAEEIMVWRNILLSELTGGPVHLAHLSTAGSMDLVRNAKAKGLKVTVEVTPHHFTLTEESVLQHRSNAKMNPPLRRESDVQAILKAIQDGTVDVIASDHAPHPAKEKAKSLSLAPFGIIGLETSVSLGLDRLVHSGLISLNRLIELYSLNAARILNIPRGISEGSDANLTVLDPATKVKVNADRFFSRSRNTPFHAWELQGRPAATIYKGVLVWCEESLRSRIV